MKTITMMAFAATLFVFSACSNDKNDDLNNPVDNTAPVAAQFTAGIAIRAFDQQWDMNDLIGVTGTSGDVEYKNVNYHTIAGDGAFSAVTVGEEIYFQVPTPTVFTAYYPFAGMSGTLQTNIPVSTESQKIQKSFDFLYSTGSGSKANPIVTFLFGHSMSKLILNIKPGADITFADITGGSSILTGVNHDGSFDTSTGVAATTGADMPPWAMSTKATASDVTSPVGSEVRTYSLILFPQTMPGALVYSAVIGGQPYIASIVTGLTMEAGNSYSYNITVNKTSLTVSEATINPWLVGNGPGGTDVDAEM